MTHKEIVLRHLEDYGSITSFDAFREYGITRLSATIFNLRRDGYKISNKTEGCINRYGRKVHFDRYVMEDADVAIKVSC